MTTVNEQIYEELQEAAASKATGSAVASIILRAYSAGWETGDIHEALGEGGYDLSFGTIEALAQRSVLLTGEEA